MHRTDHPQLQESSVLAPSAGETADRTARPAVSRIASLGAGILGFACLLALSTLTVRAEPSQQGGTEAAVQDSTQATASQPAAPTESPEANEPAGDAAAETAASEQRRGELPTRPRATVPVSPKIRRYAERLVRRYDRDANGLLDRSEWQAMAGQPATIDADGDAALSIEEVAQHVARYAQTAGRLGGGPAAGPQAQSAAGGATSTVLAESPATGEPTPRPARRFFVPPERLPQGLPEWFMAADRDGDAQLDLAEFLSAAQAGSETFARLDRNSDGLLTAQEFAAARYAQGDGEDRSEENGGQAEPTP